jgi:hypothetical protein
MRCFWWILLLVLALGGCTNQPAAEAKQVQTVKLEKGAKINMILLKELSSGGTEEGSEVPLMASEDVKDSSGHLLIPKGTPIAGIVTWSRSEGSLGSVLNQPARLKLKFTGGKAVDGTAFKLSAKADAPDEEFELNRDNTGQVQVSQTLDTLAENKDNQQALDALRELFESGQASHLEDPATKQKLAELANQLGLPATATLAKKDEIDKMADLVSQIRHGATAASLATGGSAALVDAALELAGIAGQMGSRLARTLGGRNIRAYVGTPITAYVAETVEIKIGT